MMSDSKEYRRSVSITPKTTTQFNQFLPSKDKQTGYVPAPLRKKRADRNDENRQSWGAPLYTDDDGNFASRERAGSDRSSVPELKSQSPHLPRAYEYETSDSDADRQDPDLILDDFASRRFHSPSPVAPTNFAIPINPLVAAAIPRTNRPQVTVTNVPRQMLTHLSSPSQPLQKTSRRPGSAELCIYDESEEEDDEFGYADPVQDDLYARKVGLTPQPAATLPFDKFLPKFWTPEEDAHVKMIKLGSQRRPWYRKIQGFSRTRSGSSSDDSDGDVNPWHSLPSFSRTQSEPPPSHPHSPEGHAHSSLTSTSSCETQPPMVAQQIAGLPKLESLDFWPRPDPTSGPRLIKCEKHPLLGREHPNDPYNVSPDIVPDLENDDMFTRRTKSFQSSDDLAKMKYGHFLVPRHRSATDVTVVTPRRDGEPIYPDIEKDDVVYRRVQQQLNQRPLSGAPDNYYPVPIPEPWTLPPKLQAKLMCPPCEPRQRQPRAEITHEEHLKTDDMLLRKLKALNTQGTANATDVGQSLAVPLSCSEEDLQKWQAIRDASRVRYRKRLMVERLLEESTTTDGSKSVTDITEQINWSNVNKEIRFEELRKMREQIKEHEEQWQDDLTRWKTKRRSVNSDIVKKKEERDQIEQITTTSSSRKSKTFSEMQDERDSRVQSNRSSFNFGSDDVFEGPVPTRRTLQHRSYTIDTPFAPMDKPSAPSVPSLKQEETVAGTPASDQTNLTAKHDRSSSEITRNMTNSVQESLLDDPTPAISSSDTSVLKPTSLIKPTSVTKPSTVVSSSQQSFSSAKPIENSSGPISSLYKTSSMETKPSGSDQVSASLPRSYQRLDSARLTSVVTPRPFGAQANRVTSLPRTFMVDDSHKRMNGDSLKKPSVPSRYAQFATEDENLSQGSPMNSSNEEEEEERSAAQTSSTVPLINRVSPLPKSPSHLSPSNEGDYSDMRISLNQKPNSSQDFGFQTNWDSLGVRVKSVEPGSPAQLAQVKVGDEILTVNGHKVADMSYAEWKNSMEDALKQGGLLMDIRRYGRNSSPEPHLSANLNFTSNQTRDTVVKTVNVSSQPVINYRSNGTNGGFSDDPGTVNNKGGSDTAISNLPVPSITTSSTHMSWDPEHDRKRQEKWQKEQELKLQEKYKKDQEKLDEEWKKAQQEIANKNAAKVQESSRLAQQEEERKKREQERQRLEDERRKREEQQRLEEERKKREEEERLRQEAETKRREEQEALSKSTPELDEVAKPDIKASGGLGEVGKDYKKESHSHAEIDRQQIIQDMKKKTALNTDNSWIRQQSIYNNTAKEPVNQQMRRGESLDNLDAPRSSWRSSWAPGSTSSIPDYSRPYSSSSSNSSGRPGSVALQTSQSMNSLRQSWSPSTPPSATSPEPRAPPRNKSVSGRKICSSCNIPLGKGAAMIIESLGLCFHLTCFKCVNCRSELGGSEAGAEVRIRNQQLYCNVCYVRLKTGQPTAM